MEIFSIEFKHSIYVLECVGSCCFANPWKTHKQQLSSCHNYSSFLALYCTAKDMQAFPLEGETDYVMMWQVSVGLASGGSITAYKLICYIQQSRTLKTAISNCVCGTLF